MSAADAVSDRVYKRARRLGRMDGSRGERELLSKLDRETRPGPALPSIAANLGNGSALTDDAERKPSAG